MNGWATLLVFLPPALLLFTIFVALPMVEAGWYSFFNWNGFGRPEKFIGLKNYVYVASNTAFTRALINNGLIIVASLLVQLPLALGVALLIAGRMTGAVWFRMVFFLPYILADVAAGLIWRFMLDGQIGLPAIVTSLLGLQPFYLLGSTDWAFSRCADRDPLEVFRLPHDALHRWPPGHRQGDAGGGRDGRRQALPEVLAHHAAPAWAR